jgi:hypothetical protein
MGQKGSIHLLGIPAGAFAVKKTHREPFFLWRLLEIVDKNPQ